MRPMLDWLIKLGNLTSRNLKSLWCFETNSLVGVINEIFQTNKGMNVFLAYAKLLTLSFAKNFTILRVFTCKISDKGY